MKRARYAVAAFATLMTMCMGSSAWSASAAAPVYPGAGWEQIAPDTLGPACRQDLDAVRERLKAIGTTALVAVQDGRVLLDYGPVDEVSSIASARKSLLAMLYGRPVADGTIDLDETLGQLGIHDIGGLLPIEREATVRELLTARSGVYHASANGGDNGMFAPPRGSKAPGTFFLYNNWDFNVAGTIYTMRTHRDIFHAFAEDIAAPLQLQDFDLARHRLRGDARRSKHPAYPFYLSTRDMARVGYLMLEHGNWRGRQIVPADWVTTITTPVSRAADMQPRHTRHHQSDYDYGYLWWILTEPAASPLAGAYMAWGQYGQFILVIPKRNMVIAHKRVVPDDKFGQDHPGDVRWVQEADFLGVARRLASAPCS